MYTCRYVCGYMQSTFIFFSTSCLFHAQINISVSGWKSQNLLKMQTFTANFTWCYLEVSLKIEEIWIWIIFIWPSLCTQKKNLTLALLSACTKKKEAPTTDHMGTKVPGRKVWSNCRIWMKNILVTKLNILNFFITKQCYCLCIWKQWLFSVKSQHCLVTDSRIPAGQEVDKQSQVWSAKSMGWMALALCFLA